MSKTKQSGTSRLLRSLYRERWAYIFLAVPLALFIVFRVFPVMATLALGFADYFPGGRPLFVGLNNYGYALSDDLFWKSVGQTALYTLGVVPASVLISLVLAQLIVGLGHRWAQTVFKSAFYVPVVTSGAILSLVWLWLFNPARGLFNYVLSFVGLGPYAWISDPDMALPSLVFMAIAGGHGAAIVLLTAAMGNIPVTYYEAARIDGASGWRQFWQITVPLLRPTLLYLIVTTTIASFQVFTQVLMMTGGGPNYATTTLVYLIFTDAFEYFDFGKAAAEATILSIGLAVVAVIQYRWLASDVEY